jgi:hypothetical protein
VDKIGFSWGATPHKPHVLGQPRSSAFTSNSCACRHKNASYPAVCLGRRTINVRLEISFSTTPLSGPLRMPLSRTQPIPDPRRARRANRVWPQLLWLIVRLTTSCASGSATVGLGLDRSGHSGSVSHLALDLGEPPVGGWVAYLAGRGLEVLTDDLGRPAVSRADARQLLDERRDSIAGWAVAARCIRPPQAMTLGVQLRVMRSRRLLLPPDAESRARRRSARMWRLRSPIVAFPPFLGRLAV